MILLYLSSAFDNINHDMLMYMLYSLGISDAPYRVHVYFGLNLILLIVLPL